MKVEKLLAKAIAYAMCEKGMNKLELCKQSGLSYPTIVGICKGDTSSTTTINRIMKVLDMQVSFSYSKNDNVDLNTIL